MVRSQTPAQVAADAMLKAEEAVALNVKTHKLVSDLHAALMEPQAGYDRSLLDRMAAVTISIESGDRTLKTVVKFAQIVGAIGVIVGGFYAAVRFGGAQK